MSEDLAVQAIKKMADTILLMTESSAVIFSRFGLADPQTQIFAVFGYEATPEI